MALAAAGHKRRLPLGKPILGRMGLARYRQYRPFCLE
jgi:hypothetical protein